jgi:hypothetical protein
MLIGTGCVGQHFHLISMAIVNSEVISNPNQDWIVSTFGGSDKTSMIGQDTAAHLVVWQQTKLAVEAAVESRARRNLRV